MVRVKVEWCTGGSGGAGGTPQSRYFTKGQYDPDETDDEFADRIAAALKANKPTGNCSPSFP